MKINKLFAGLSKKMFGRGGNNMKKKVKAKKVAKKTKIKAKKTAKKVIKKIAKKKIAKKAVKKVQAKKASTKSLKKEVKIVAKPAKGKASQTIEIAAPKELKLKKGPHTIYVGIGSNVGDREEYIEQARFLLSKTEGLKIMKKSTNYETEAEGPGDQQPYMNAVVEIKTMMDPYKFLLVLQETENALGRERDVDWGPRTIDLDLLMYDDLIISDDKLQVPHPLLHERMFVLKPFSDIAPKVQHPVLEKTIEELFEERKTDLGDKYDDELPGFKEIRKGTPDDYERW